MPYESMCQFHYFFSSWADMNSSRQNCEDIIQIEFENNVNKRARIVYRLEFLGSQR